ncbi:MAG TPA: glycosyltransferase family 2 protein [Opitutaceae bacterium]|nr:glycosyltransferase family 2 protein [Opitutaceae bacterium]
MPPALSVVIACKNPGPRLAVALGSVWEQRDAAVETIVIDGGSTDGTPESLERDHGRLTAFVSEPDAGVYDAMNKGLAVARGDWVLFLGADDRLVGTRILSEALNWTKKTEAGVVAGEVAYDDGRLYKLHARVNPLARNFMHHQAAFYRRSLFEENGRFDTSLAIMADYEFNLRLWKNRVRFKPIPLRIAACGVGGLSDAGSWRGYREEIAVRHRYFPLWRCAAWDALSVLRWARKQIVRRARPHHG